MKILIEIEDKKLKYAYEIGTSSQTSEMPLSTDGFILIADVLRMVSHHTDSDIKKRLRTVICEKCKKEME